MICYKSGQLQFVQAKNITNDVKRKMIAKGRSAQTDLGL